MDPQLIKLFAINNLEFEENYFNDAKIIKTEYSTKEYVFRVVIKINDFLPSNILLKLEKTLLNNQKLPTKILLQVCQKQYNLTIIFSYLEYIRLNKSELKNSFFSKLSPNRFSLTDNILKIIVYSESEQKLVSKHCKYYQKKLRQYGFNDLQLELIIYLQENNILKINEQELIKYQKTAKKNEGFITKIPISNSNQIYKKTNNYNNKKQKNANYKQLIDIDKDISNIIIHGKIINKERQLISTKKYIYTITITDYSDTIKAKKFTSGEQPNVFFEELKINEWVGIFGNISYDSYIKEQIFFIKNIFYLEREDLYRKDNANKKRVELHLHTKMSAMDGVTDITMLFKTLHNWNHKAIAFTDHLNVQIYPEIYNINKKYPDIKVIYGVEMDVLDDEVLYVKNSHHHNLQTTKYVIFDLETTGLSSNYDEIIEFGAVIMNGISGERQNINHLFKSSIKLSTFTTELTGITDELLLDKPSFIESIDKILEYFKDAILVAHNAEFDMGFIQSWLEKAGYSKINNTVIDTLQLSRILEPHLKNYRLGTIARCYNIVYNEKIAHRADYDAIVLTDIYECQFWKMINNYGIKFDDDINKIHNSFIYKKIRSKHITILVKNQTGLLELFKLITAAHTKYFYSSPKLLRSTINKHRSNLLIGSSCVNGDVFEFARNKNLHELRKIISFYDYIEIQPPSVYKHLVQMGDLSETRLLTIIKNIILTAQELNKLIVATGDVHYLNPEDKIFRDIYINAKRIGGKSHPLYDYNKRVINNPDQFLRTTTEMINEFKFLNDDKLINKIVIINSNLIAEKIEKIEIIKDKLYTPKITDSDKLLKKICYKNAYKIYGNPLPEIVAIRLKNELNTIIKHNFSVIYWIAHKIVNKSLQDGYLVGSRGSVGSSFVATMSNITEVNPLQPHYLCSNCNYSKFIVNGSVKCGYDLPISICPKCHQHLKGEGHDIPFETFLGFKTDKVPDIDLNFSGEYQSIAHDFMKEILGDKNIYRAGTISTVAKKTAYGYVKNYFENKNILHLKRRVELERIAKGCEGVKRTTGQHPGGIIIIPNEYEVEEFTPVNFPADDINSNWLTTHLDFHAINNNVLKLDILGHVDPTALRMLQNLTGVDPKAIPTNDKMVLSLFQSLDILKIKSENINGEKTGVIGIPEFGTFFVRKMLSEIKPTSFADLVQISGLSHGTDVWIGNAQELVKNKNITLSDVIGCRDDIMTNLIYKGLSIQNAFKIMEDVRKGNGLTKEQEKLMRNNNVDQWYIDSCNKIKYMFPKAHATAYVLMAWRVAWYKINYPIEYYATFFSTRTDVFDIKTILKGEKTIKQVLRDIQTRLDNKDFNTSIKPSQKEKDLIPVYELALEMYARGIKMSNINLKTSLNKNFIIITNENNEKIILPPFSAIDGLGDAVGISIINARNEKPFLSITDLQKRTNITKTHLKSFEELGILKGLSLDNQIVFEF